MNNNKFPRMRLLFLAAGLVAVSALAVTVFILLDSFSYRDITGTVLGSVVSLAGFAVLCVAVNRAVDNVMAERGNGVLDEEQAAEFAARHSSSINAAVRLSSISRLLGMAAVLVVAFVTDWFDVIATLVPLVAFQPLLMLSGLFFDKEG